MRLRSVKPGDILHVEVNGVRFYATYTGTLHTDGSVSIAPLHPNISWQRIKSRDIIGHYAKRAGSA